MWDLITNDDPDLFLRVCFFLPILTLIIQARYVTINQKT